MLIVCCIYVCSRNKLEETKMSQKLRIKPHGVNAVALAAGKKLAEEDLVLKVWAKISNSKARIEK